MGTRCLTKVVDDDKEILCLYRQHDGYPEGHGRELKDAFEGFKITNGISGGVTKTANGMGCLAAQIVCELKSIGDGARVGGIYVYPIGSHDCGEEYVYTLSNKSNRIWLRLTDIDGEKLYSGFLDAFVPDDH